MPDIIFPNLGITFQSINRIAFSIFGFDIHWYALFVVMGVLAGVYFGAIFAPKRTGQDSGLYMDFAFYVIPICIVGARLFFVIFSWELYRDNFWGIFALREGGLAIFGVIIAAIATSLVFCKIKKYNWLLFADTGIVGLIIGHAIGRIGNFVNREAFGSYTDGLFAMQLRLDQVWQPHAVTQEMLDNIIVQYGAQYIQVHPTFFYEMAINLLLFVFLNIYRKHKKFNGELLAYYFLVYGITRTFTESLRTDPLLVAGTNFSVSMLMSIIIALLAIVFLAFNFIKHFRGRASKIV